MWADNHRIKWPPMPDDRLPAEHLLAINPAPSTPSANNPPLNAQIPVPAVITFSHFLPRVELVFSDWNRFLAGGEVSGNDRAPEFNFTRVAGCTQLDAMLRAHGSVVHLYGHQHRNRDRVIDGVRYISHCLGYPPEWHDHDTDPPRHLPLEIKLNTCGS
jgi:hypothetical protein